MSWQKEIFIMESKRILSYRIDFWLQFAVIVVTEISIAYYLWLNIFNQQNKVELGGLSFDQMIIYYCLIPFIVRIVKSSDDFGISREIYEGKINKYLIYPVSFLNYKFIERLAYSCMSFFQMIIGMFVISFFVPIFENVTFLNLITAVLFCFLSFALYFFISFILEMFSFWFESVWSLGVMLRFITMFFGGAMIPLSLFPDLLFKILEFTPFPYLFSVPMKIILGQMHALEIMNASIVTIAWILPAYLLSVLVLRKGLKNYTGIGI